MANHSSSLTWEISWTEKLGGYSPWGHKAVGHDWETKLWSQDFSVNVTLYTSREISPNVFWDNLASGVCFCLVLIETFFLKKSTLLRYNLHNLHSRHMFECIVWWVLTNAYMCICDLSKKKKKHKPLPSLRKFPLALLQSALPFLMKAGIRFLSLSWLE